MGIRSFVLFGKTDCHGQSADWPRNDSFLHSFIIAFDRRKTRAVFYENFIYKSIEIL